MGIRIHKRLGYALTDVETDDDGLIVDPRFSDRVHDWEWLYDSSDEFLDWLRSQDDESLADIAQQHLHQISPIYVRFASRDLPNQRLGHHRAVEHLREFGDPSVFLLQCIGKLDWTRRDDSIDYYEAAGQTETKVQPIGGSGVYPFNGSFHRKPSVEAPDYALGIEDPLIEAGFREGKLEPYDYACLTGTWTETSSPKASGEVLRHLQEDWGVIIPPQIQLYVWWSGIFSDINTMYDLKPIIYTYWT